jgi:hypothetical protein
MEKNRVKMATEISKSNFADRKLRVDDDFRRDEMIVKGILDAAKIEAQFAADVDEEEFKSENTPQSTAEPSPLPVPYAQQLMGLANGSQEPAEPAGPPEGAPASAIGTAP